MNYSWLENIKDPLLIFDDYVVNFDSEKNTPNPLSNFVLNPEKNSPTLQKIDYSNEHLRSIRCALSFALTFFTLSLFFFKMDANRYDHTKSITINVFHSKIYRVHKQPQNIKHDIIKSIPQIKMQWVIINNTARANKRNIKSKREISAFSWTQSICTNIRLLRCFCEHKVIRINH